MDAAPTTAPAASNTAPVTDTSSGDGPDVAPPAGRPSVADQVARGGQTSDSENKPAPKAEDKPTPPARHKFTLKVDGQEESLELTPEEIQVRLQRERAANKRFQQAAEERKRVQAFIEMVEKNPAEAVKFVTGGKVDLTKWAEQDLLRRYEESQMTPEQREKLALQRQIDQYQNQEKTRAEQIQAQQRVAFEEKVRNETEQELMAGLKQTGYSMEVQKMVLPMMAEIASANLEFGIELTPAQMANETKRRVETMAGNLVKGMSGEQLANFLGPAAVKSILQHQLAAHKLQASPGQPRPAPEPEEKTEPRREMSPSEFRRKHMFGIEPVKR